jgi:signal transduction histidine kinase
MEGILPNLGFGDEKYEWFVLIVVGFDSILCLIWFGWYIGSPLILIMKWIDQLANEDFSQLHDAQKIYKQSGKLKMRFRLYQEVIAQLNQMRAQLERAGIERLQLEKDKRDWIAGISHDLKTPLTYIKGYATLLLNPTYQWSKEEQHSFIQEIEDKSTHMEHLVEDINLAIRFDGSQSVPIHKTEQNLIQFVQQILAAISNDLRAKKHHFELRIKTDQMNLHFDSNLLKRAFENIYMNAVIHNEVPVEVITTVKKQDAMFIIEIQDNGVGMTEETQRHLFHRYYRGTSTEQKSEGTGLGMAIVKSLIEAHGGSIVVESELQQGTKFIVTLPIDKVSENKRE